MGKQIVKGYASTVHELDDHPNFVIKCQTRPGEMFLAKREFHRLNRGSTSDHSGGDLLSIRTADIDATRLPRPRPLDDYETCPTTEGRHQFGLGSWS